MPFAPADLSQTQRRLLATLEELRGLGRDDPRYASQQQTVKVLDEVETALATARLYADAQAWDDVITRLEPWHNRPDLRDVARDLYAKVEKLFGDAEDYRIYRHRREFFEHVQNALALGDLKQIQRLCKDAHQTLDRNEIVRAQITALEQALPVLTNAITALQSGDVAKMTRLKPEVYPEICYLLVQQINAIYQAARYLKLAQNSNTDIDSAQKALTQALQISPDMPLPLWDIRRTLITEAGERVRELLHKQITSGATLTSEELGRYEEALSQVQAVVGSVEPGLLTSQVLLAQRREQMLTAQVAQGQTGLTTALGTTSGQISGAIGQVKTDLGTKVSALETSISTLTSISAQQSLAGKADLTRIGGAITNQLDDLAKQDAAISIAVRTITPRLDNLTTSNERLSNQITSIDNLMNSLRENDEWLIQEHQAINKKLDALEVLLKLSRFSLFEWLLKKPKSAQDFEDVGDGTSALSPAPAINGKSQTQRDGDSRKERGRARSSVDGSGKRGKTGFPLVPVVAVGAAVIAIIVLAFFANSLFQSRKSSIVAISTPTVVTTVTPKITETAAAATTVAQEPEATVATTTTTQNPAPETPTASPSDIPTGGTTTTTTVVVNTSAPVVSGNALVAQLGQTVDLPAEAAGASGTVTLVIGNLTVPLTVTAKTGKPASITIPESLLLTNTLDFALPSNATLSVTNLISVPLRIQMSMLTMTTVTSRTGETLFIDKKGTISAAYLWYEPKISTVENGAINLGTVAKPNYLGLQKGDTFRLLEGKGEFYKVAVMTNQADKENAIGQVGWIRKTLVHGGK